MPGTWCSILVVLFLRGTSAGIVRKPPAFSTPVYSDAYLPASMQVIFHAVEQLKRLQMEETQHSMPPVPATSPHPPGQQQPVPAASPGVPTTETATPTHVEEPEVDEEVPVTNQEVSEVSEERSEDRHVTAETIHEEPEAIHEMRKADKGDREDTSTIKDPLGISITDASRRLAPTVDSVVGGIYVIVKPGSSSSSAEKHDVETKTEEERDNLDEELDENRFSLLGERVVQVPRPSLYGYLRRVKVPPRPSLHQLAMLYDALGKDARRQGFSKFAGYSDVILTALETSAGGGVGPQLKTLLEKTLEKNELTRDDTKEKAKSVIRDLEDSGSSLNTDLRRLLPLRYAP